MRAELVPEATGNELDPLTCARCGHRLCQGRETDAKRRAASDFAVHRDGTPEQLRETPDHVQTETHASVASGHRSVDLPERLEDDWHVLRCDAYSCITHEQFDGVPARLCPDGNPTAIGELHRILYEILEDHLELVGVRS